MSQCDLHKELSVLCLIRVLLPGQARDSIKTMACELGQLAISRVACEQALLFGRVKRFSRERCERAAPRSPVLARLASLAQMGELARRLFPEFQTLSVLNLHT